MDRPEDTAEARDARPFQPGMLDDDGDTETILASATTVTPVRQRPAGLSRHQLLELAQSNPKALFKRATEKYDAEIDAYSCTFIKQERVNGELRPKEQIEVRYRERPHSIFMIWKDNADQARRALYIDSPEYRNSKGEKLVKVEPNGAVARLFVSEIKLPMHGDRAEKASRRPMDLFGFRVLLHFLDVYNSRAERRGELQLKFVGEGEIDGRPTIVFERFLPLKGNENIYPDAKMVMQIDQEWLVPVSIKSYADHKGKVLLGHYEYHDVRLNPKFDAHDFEF